MKGSTPYLLLQETRITKHNYEEEIGTGSNINVRD